MDAVRLRKLVSGELAWLLDVESAAAREGYIRGDAAAVHEERLSDPGSLYLIGSISGEDVGFAILRGLGGVDLNIELKRVVIANPGRGVGQKFLTKTIDYAFDELEAHRLWLDTLSTNARAQHVYEKLGFQREGVLREAILVDGAHRDLILYGLLRTEWSRC